MTDVLQPHDLDAERAILGSILIENEQFEHARTVVAAEDFYRVAHQQIFRGLSKLLERREKADLVTLVAHLRQGGTLEDVGGHVYVAQLVDGVPRSSNVPYYAGIVKAHALRRALVDMGRKAIAAAQNTDATIDELVDATEVALASIGAQQSSDLVSGQALASEALAWLDDVSARRQQGQMSGIATGIADLDALTDGLQPGELVMVGARPSQGKTALALQLALACDGPAAFFSLEMKRAQLAARAIAWLARVDGWTLRRGLLSDREYERVGKALTSLAEGGLAIDDASDLTIWQIRSKARRWKVQHGLSLVVVDYLQLVTPVRDKRMQGNREQEVAAMSRAFKGMAKDLHVPVILLAQLNRSVEGRADAAPKLSDLRESGALEQDADVVILLHRPGGKSVKDEGEAHLIVAKHRNGPTGTVPVWWVPSMTAFKPLPAEVA